MPSLEDPKFNYVDVMIDESLLCVACQHPLEHPVSSSCGCSFCEHCITELMRKPNGNACPSCRSKLRRGYYPLVLSHEQQQYIATIQIQCNTCDEMMPRIEFKNHIRNCPLQCPLQCGQTITRDTWNIHSTMCYNSIVHCVAQDIGCPWKGLRYQLEDHIRYCVLEQTRPLLVQLKLENDELKKELFKKSRQLQESQQQIDTLREQMVCMRLRVQKFGIFVRTVSGKTIVLEVTEEDNIHIVKSKITAKDSIPERELRLIYSGKQLIDSKKLKDYGIGRDCTIHATLSLPSAIMQMSK